MIHQVMEKKLGQVEAGRLLGRTDRQVRRIVKRVREAGDELTQMDGSHYPWFEERGPACVLMACIDDASSRAFARFYGYEGTVRRGRTLPKVILNPHPVKSFPDRPWRKPFMLQKKKEAGAAIP